MIRRIVGDSMSPHLRPGQLVLATRMFKQLRSGEVFIFYHQGMEKIKRLEFKEDNKLFFIGDNLAFSQDSRHFGYVDRRQVLGKVIWPRINN